MADTFMLASQVSDITCLYMYICFADSALDDFVLTHSVFIPNSRLCPVLMAQYPFRATVHVMST